MNIQDALDWRYAVKEFTPRILPDQKVQALLEATRKSASSYGLQPYKLILIKSRDIREELLPYSLGQEKVLNCSHLVVLAAQTNIGDITVERFIQQFMKTRDVAYSSIEGYSTHMKQALASKSPAAKREWAHQQAYVALGTLLASAAMMNIDSCPMTGFDHKAYDKLLDLGSKGLESSSIVALGYRSPNDTSATLAKVRFDYSDIILEL